MREACMGLPWWATSGVYLVFGKDLHRVIEDGDLDHEEARDEEDTLFALFPKDRGSRARDGWEGRERRHGVG